MVLRSGYLRSGLNNRCLRHGPNSRLRARLSRLSRPASLPSRIERHLPHLAHPLLRSPRQNHGLIDPRLQLIQRRHRTSGDDPVVSDVSLRPLDAGNLRSSKAENAASD